MSDDERKELNLKVGRLIHLSHGIQISVTENRYDVLREKGFVGYSEYYLKRFYNESKLRNQATTKIYKKLLEIDSQLGTTQTETLFGCVFYSVRMDLIKVRVILVL